MEHPTFKNTFLNLIGLSAVLMTATSAALGDELVVVGVEPPAHSVSAALNSPIVVRFDRPVRRESVVPLRSFWAFGRWSGTVSGPFEFSDGDRTVTLRPERPFAAGESVMVILSHDLQAADGLFLRSAGYSWQFYTNARRAARVWSQIDQMTTRTSPGMTSRAYGGIASDLNGDGFPDLTIVNEDTADLRVFMNRADRSGLFDPFIQPTFPVGARASPSEPADFNRDGLVDICVANINADTVSILLGQGDGTFAPQQLVAVGVDPRGIAVLDADGDGDIDIVNTNSTTNNMSMLLNNGAGVFGAPTFFEGGGNGEWALAAADMNDDRVLDLVIGARFGLQIIVATGNGGGTFAPFSTQNADGGPWMLVCGDVDGNSTEDVAVANGTTGNPLRAAILRGDGAGHLALPERYSTDGSIVLASDLGDLDGDDDLDWLTSSYSGDWRVFINNGLGTFAFSNEFNSPTAASCSLMLDFDLDGDLDLALIDEEADVVILMKNSGTAPMLGDANADCRIDLSDHADLVGCLGGPGVSAAPQCAVFDFDDDGDVDLSDAAGFQFSFTGAESIPHCTP